jgi:hypothetical protein
MDLRKVLAAVVALVPMFGMLAAQDEPKTREGQTTDQRMPEFQPSKEHQLLKQFDGDWEFKAKCNVPGQEAMEGQGTETCRLTLGGFWLECEDKGTIKNKDWSGKGFIGWDPAKKKYMGVWVDSQAPFMGHFEGEADSSGKVFTYRFTMMDHQKMMEHQKGKGSAKEAETGRKDTGKEYGKDQGRDTRKEMGKESGMMKMPERMVHEIKDQDHRTLKFYGKDESGKEQVWTEITYTRKPAMVK